MNATEEEGKKKELAEEYQLVISLTKRRRQEEEAVFEAYDQGEKFCQVSVDYDQGKSLPGIG